MDLPPIEVNSEASQTLIFEENSEKLTHGIFKFPAKLHPPATRKILDIYTKPGDVILDPFCGSGTVNLESCVSGRKSIGYDCDPLALFIARGKVNPYAASNASRIADSFLSNSHLVKFEKNYVRNSNEASAEQHHNLRRRELISYLPNLPRLNHWFHPEVALDLAELKREIDLYPLVKGKALLWLAFAPTIRAASYADPVPVSGLEVTHIMRKKYMTD